MAGGGGGHFDRSREEIERLREEVRRDLQRQERLETQNQFLAELLARLNDRDSELTQERLRAISEAIEALGHDVEKLMFGGSVAKHTYVNGLSDVDALVFLAGHRGETPAELLQSFALALKGTLPAGEVLSVTPGRMAVTVAYRDGSELQLLPAVERGGHTVISSEDGREWRQIRPHKFVEKLTEVNKATGNGAVPAIKLAKSLIHALPSTQRLSGYHIEAIAVDAFRQYEGPRDRASMLSHLMRRAAQSVLRPSGDITGQSVHIDHHLGPANSAARLAISHALSGIASRLSNAASISEYKLVFGD